MADGTILVGLKDTEVESDAADSLERRGCQLCLEKPAQYTCPRCNVRYCSLECYKCEKHMTCSELFYKTCVMEALRDDTVDEEGKQRMLEVLKRHQQEESEDFLLEEGREDLADRLEGLNLDQDTVKIWENLTEAEKREFEKAVDNGYIGSLMDMWVPWWITDEPRSLNENFPEMSKDDKIIASAIPKVLKNIPKLQSLMKSKEPSSDMKYSLIGILYSYVYICKFYNGSYCDFLQEAVEGLWKLSSVLHHTINFSSLDSVLRNCVESSLQHKEYFNSEAFSLSVIDDVSLLLKGSVNESESCFVEAALSDIYKLLGKGIKLYKSDESSENNKPKDIGKSLWLAKKKVHFTLAWFHDNQDECFSLEPFLPVMKEALKLEFNQIQDAKKLVEKCRNSASLGNKKLIEEM